MRKIVIVVAVLALALVGLVGTAAAVNAKSPAAGFALADATPTPTSGQQAAYVGITVANITDQIAQRLNLSQKTGVVITSVLRNSPAATAGLQRGDVITAVNGTSVSTAQDVTAQVAKAKPGDTITFAVTRGTQNLTIQVTAGSKPTPVKRFGFGFFGFGGFGGGLVSPDLQALLDGVPQNELFSHYYGATATIKDKNNNVVTVNLIPGVVTNISATSIQITPNNPQGRGGPFSIDGNTIILGVARTAGASGIAVNDQVVIVVVGDSNHASVIMKVNANAGMGGIFGGRGGFRGFGGKGGFFPGNNGLRNNLRGVTPQATPVPGTSA